MENNLFSAIVALYTLIFLYFPFYPFFFSPVLFSTSVLFFYLLRLGASQRTVRFNYGPVQAQSTPRDSRNDGPVPGHIPDPNPTHEDASFVEWNVRAPLEVILEEYEGDEGEEQNDDVLRRKRDADIGAIERYASLSLYYPETDSDSCSSEGDFTGIGEWGSPENECFRWEGEEDDREELIEIKLDGKRSAVANDVFVEEDNLIEIDLFPATGNDGFYYEVLDY